jgi:DNA-binding transcriptional MerR regulator
VRTELETLRRDRTVLDEERAGDVKKKAKAELQCQELEEAVKADAEAKEELEETIQDLEKKIQIETNKLNQAAADCTKAQDEERKLKSE